MAQPTRLPALPDSCMDDRTRAAYTLVGSAPSAVLYRTTDSM